MVELLLREGADVDGVADGESPLTLAAYHGSADAVRLLLAAGASARPPSADGWSALHSAAQEGYVDVVRQLLANGDVDPAAADSAGYTPLHAAAQAGGGLEVVCLLLNAGAAVDARETDGTTPLFLACAAGDAPVVHALLEAGADVNASLSGGGTPLMAAAEGSGSFNMLRALLARGARTDAVERSGATALHFACEGRSRRRVFALLWAGADASARDRRGHTPVEVALLRGNKPLAAAVVNEVAWIAFLPELRDVVRRCAATRSSSRRLPVRRVAGAGASAAAATAVSTAVSDDPTIAGLARLPDALIDVVLGYIAPQRRDR